MIENLLQRDWPLAVALFFVAWLTAGAMAVRSVSRIWLRHWTERRLRGAVAAATYLERPQRLLTAAGVGVALTLVFAGVLVGLLESGGSLLLRVVIFGGFVVLLGQILPRAIARRWPTQLVPVLVPVLQAAQVVAKPIAAIGRLAASPLERRRGHAVAVAERDPLQDLLREGELEGVGEREEIAIISGVVEFGEKVVRSVMTPRADIFALDESLDLRTMADQIAQSAYSRVPIYRGSLDDIRGMVHVFDIIKAYGELEIPSAPPLRPVANAAPETPCNELLFRMLRERQHLAIVRDSHGATLGLVTLEDLLEELVGDIRDEHDEPETPRQSDSARGSSK